MSISTSKFLPRKILMHPLDNQKMTMKKGFFIRGEILRRQQREMNILFISGNTFWTVYYFCRRAKNWQLPLGPAYLVQEYFLRFLDSFFLVPRLAQSTFASTGKFPVLAFSSLCVRQLYLQASFLGLCGWQFSLRFG